MGEPKPSASLSSGLLARKGTARPAMRRQGLGALSAAAHDDLGWNDMGHDADAEGEHATTQQLPIAMPGVSPLSVKPDHSHHSNDVQEDFSADRQDENRDNVARLSDSPMSVKPGKPQVVLQREELEDNFRTPQGESSQDVDEEDEDDVYSGPEPEDTDSDPSAFEDGDDSEENEIAERTASLLSVKPEFERETRLNVEIGEESDDVAADRHVIAETAQTSQAPRAEAIETPKAIPAPSRTEPDQAPTLPAKAMRQPPKLPKSRSTKAKAAFTLRIDRDRHLKLRLASALTNLSAQQILTDAFDRYLETLPEVEALASNIRQRAAE